MDATASPSPFESLPAILRLLLAAIGGWGLDGARAVLLHRRIAALALRVERMLARFRAGRLQRATQRATRVIAIRRASCALPRRYGWLVQECGYRAAGFGSLLQTALSAPEMIEFLAASPQTVRLLRPLCRALAVELPASVAPPRKPASSCPERPKRSRRRRMAPEPFRIPLPRGVLSAARREGFGKLR